MIPFAERFYQNMYSVSLFFLFVPIDFTPLYSSRPRVLVHAFAEIGPRVWVKSYNLYLDTK